jgi:hypothetical protein
VTAKKKTKTPFEYFIISLAGRVPRAQGVGQ